MRIRKYDITLVRLKEKDIELVRVKRNSNEINQFMQFRDLITPEMQYNWFKSINTIYHNYFLIYFQNKPIGLINGKNSDFEKRTSEGGMFIWDNFYIDTYIPALCSVIMSDYNFLINEFNINYIQVLNENVKVKAYNKKLGYTLCLDRSSDKTIVWYELTKENYIKNIGRIRKGVEILTGDGSPLNLNDIDFNDDTKEELMNLYAPLPNFIREKVEKVLINEGRKLSS